MWNRRELLGVLGTGAAGVALLTPRSEAGDRSDRPGRRQARRARPPARGHAQGVRRGVRTLRGRLQCRVPPLHRAGRGRQGRTRQDGSVGRRLCGILYPLGGHDLAAQLPHGGILPCLCRGLPPVCRGVRYVQLRRDDENLRHRLQAVRGELPKHGQGHGRRAPALEQSAEGLSCDMMPAATIPDPPDAPAGADLSRSAIGPGPRL